MSWKKSSHVLASSPGRIAFPTYVVPKEHRVGLLKCCGRFPVYQSVTMCDDLVCTKCLHRAGCFDGEWSWVKQTWNSSIQWRKRKELSSKSRGKQSS